jgi:hypothetical protein
MATFITTSPIKVDGLGTLSGFSVLNYYLGNEKSMKI